MSRSAAFKGTRRRSASPGPTPLPCARKWRQRSWRTSFSPYRAILEQLTTLFTPLAIAAVKTRSRTTIDAAKQVAVRLDPKYLTLDDKARKEIAKDPAGYTASLQASLALLQQTDWTPEALEQRLRALAAERGVPAGKVFQPIRIALTGGTVSEPVNELLYVVGKEAALRRLQSAISGSSPG